MVLLVPKSDICGSSYPKSGSRKPLHFRGKHFMRLWLVVRMQAPVAHTLPLGGVLIEVVIMPEVTSWNRT